jgi:DNA polymerase-3 subunit delta'
MQMTTATGFDAIVGQQFPITLLKRLILRGTLPHAMLFTGDDGVGKRSTATALAMACNCRTLTSALGGQPRPDAVNACGKCAPCRKILGGHHPDVVRIGPISSVIRIDQIRSLLKTLALRPNEADQRVVILSDAQAMNPEAGNALLKMLEEPPDRTLLVLTARQASDLLPTIVSRCRHIRFFPLREADIKQLLTTTDKIDDHTAGTVAALCGGSYNRARKWVDPRWLRRRDWIIDAIGRLNDIGETQIRPWLAFSEMLAKKKEYIEESLEIVTMWLRDLLVVGCDAAPVLNRDRLDGLFERSRNIRPACLLKQIDAVDDALAALRSNTNTRLTLDAMVLKMAGALSR